MTHAQCDGCGKAYEVADPAKVYRCRCGGRVAVRPTEEASDRYCPSCGALHVDEEARYCEECGASLDGTVAARQDSVARQEANRELAIAKASVRAIRTWYRVGATLAGAMFLLVTWAVLAGGVTPLGILILGFMGGTVVVYVLGAVRIHREPMLWSILIASLETCRLGLALIGGNWIAAAILSIWTLAFWSVVARVTRVRPLIERYPELWHAESLAKERGRDRGRRRPAAGGAVARRERSARREGRRGLALAGIVVAALVLIGGGAWLATRPPSLDDALASFVDDWNRSDVDAVSRRFEDSDREKVSRWLRRKNSGRDWSERLPVASTHAVPSRGDSSARVVFGTLDGDVWTTWKLDAGTWTITAIKLDRE